jgi:hypothetical protein
MKGLILKLLSIWLLVVLCLPVAAAIPRRPSGGVSLLLAGGSENLLLTLTTDKENYVNGEQVHVSGTAYQDNAPLSSNATLTFSSGEWERRAAILIDKGQYAYDYAISFGDPDGTWNVTLQVGDNIVSNNISVSLPPDTVYYTVEIWSPPEGHFYMRGTEVQISVSVTEAGTPVENAVVSCRSSKGDNLSPFIENSPGLYSMDYNLGWDEPLGKWCISVEAKKMVENQLMAGGSYTTVEIKPAAINLDILRPTTHRFARGETVGIEVRASYQNGALPENVLVTATLPDGENMSLRKGENDTYVGSYEITSENFAGWIMQTNANDSYGNSGTSSLVISVAPPKGSLPLLLVLLVVTISLASGIAPSLIGLRKRRAGRLESISEEKRDIRKDQAEIAVRYFKKGEIPRETYDKLMRELERRFTELEKEETTRKERIKE